MFELLEELRARARRLHRSAQAGDPDAIARVTAGGDVDGDPRRRHCLAALAREFGFRGWAHLVQVVTGKESRDFGTLLCPPRCHVHWNIWSADYDEARAIRAECDGWLLAFRRDLLVVDEHYVRTLGLDPGDPDWHRIGHDWVRPGDLAARGRLYRHLMAEPVAQA